MKIQILFSINIIIDIPVMFMFVKRFYIMYFKHLYYVHNNFEVRKSTRRKIETTWMYISKRFTVYDIYTKIVNRRKYEIKYMDSGIGEYFIELCISIIAGLLDCVYK